MSLRAGAALAPLLFAPGCVAIPVAAAVGAMAVLPETEGVPEGAVFAEPDPPAPAAPDAPPQVAAPEPGDPLAGLGLGPLPPQSLTPGECGLFLFSRAAPPVFVFFDRTGAETAVIRQAGSPVPLTLAQDNDSDAQISRLYAGADGLTLRVQADLGDPVTQGRLIPQGAIRLSRAESGDLTVPVTGLTACEPD